MSHPHPELTLPPPLTTGALRVVALGGLGEIGRNMTVLETAGRLLIIDCGVLFPEDHHPGVDLILPDFSYLPSLKKSKENIRDSNPAGEGGGAAGRHRGGRPHPRA